MSLVSASSWLKGVILTLKLPSGCEERTILSCVLLMPFPSHALIISDGPETSSSLFSLTCKKLDHFPRFGDDG